MIYFTSDLHFNHENIIEHDSRPFASASHMFECIRDMWNSMVKRGDEVYVLGDFALSYGRKHAKIIDHMLASLAGNKHLIIGNHDRDEVIKNPRWRSVQHYKELKIDMGGVHRQRIVLFHYSLRSWNQSQRGSWMLHGHSHGTLPYMGGKTMDVGIMCHDYKLLSLDDICAKMAHASERISYSDCHS